VAHLRLVSTLLVPATFPRGTRGAAAFAEEALREVNGGADELALAEAPGGDRRAFLAALERTAAAVRVPLIALAPVGALDDLRALVEAGADRIGPGPAAVATPSLLEACASLLGSPRLVAEVPARRFPPAGTGSTPPGRMPAWARDRLDLLATPGGFEVLGPTGAGTRLSAYAWAAEAVRRGAGELLVTGPTWEADPTLITALSRAMRVAIAARALGPPSELRPLLYQARPDAVHLPAGGLASAGLSA
jgi:cyclase